MSIKFSFTIFHDIIFRFMIHVVSYSELFMYCVHGSYNSVFTRSKGLMWILFYLIGGGILMIISIVHSNSHIIKRITNILDYHLHHPYTVSNTLAPADLYFTDTLEDIPGIRNINKGFIVIVTNHPLGPETVIYQPFYYIFER